MVLKGKSSSPKTKLGKGLPTPVILPAAPDPKPGKVTAPKPVVPPPIPVISPEAIRGQLPLVPPPPPAIAPDLLTRLLERGQIPVGTPPPAPAPRAVPGITLPGVPTTPQQAALQFGVAPRTTLNIPGRTGGRAVPAPAPTPIPRGVGVVGSAAPSVRPQDRRDDRTGLPIAQFRGPGLEGFEAEDALRRAEIRFRFGGGEFHLEGFGGNALVRILENRGYDVRGLTDEQVRQLFASIISDPNASPISQRWVNALEQAGLIEKIEPFVTPNLGPAFAGSGFGVARARGGGRGSGGSSRGGFSFPAAMMGLVNWRI